jgi:SAM-dependent MidA family methyltransferase
MSRNIACHPSLASRLQDRIRRAGPLTFNVWMEAALYDQQEGYYCRGDRERWGKLGDYRTSPERSVLFAAVFARYYAKLHQALGSPSEWTIVEVGAGEGHFAAAVLETLQQRSPDVFFATRYIIDEASLDSQSRAAQKLARFGERVDCKRLNELNPINSGIIFSNELFDAFPVHRVTMRESQLREFYVALNGKGNFEWTIGPPSTPRLAEYFGQHGIQLAEGQIAEVNLNIEEWFRQSAGKLGNGYLISVDYGAEANDLYGSPARREGTLRAYQRHQFVDDVLACPGEQDITASVDWTFVRRIGKELGFDTIEFERQDRFLLQAGLLDELERRVSEAPDECERLSLRTSAREMILPGGMAASFQVLVQRKALYSNPR